jgi:hypothetical protein
MGVEYYKTCGKYYPVRLIGMLIIPKWYGMWPIGDLVRRGFFRATVVISWDFTK